MTNTHKVTLKGAYRNLPYAYSKYSSYREFIRDLAVRSKSYFDADTIHPHASAVDLYSIAERTVKSKRMTLDGVR